MRVKVHIPGKATHGISRVVEAQRKYLPQFDIEIVDDINEADVVNTHGADRVPVEVKQPILNTNHGLYWSRYPWKANYQEVNCMVIDAMVQAKAHTVPSEWVATSVRRGGLFYPKVVYHGIDADEWHTGENKGYVLWNKARADYVSNPVDMNKLAEQLMDVKFLSTIGKPAPNVEIMLKTKSERNLGMPFDQMKQVIQNAGLYLCTARETFGIGTLEALASGVPVVGWDWGGQSEIIIQGETGYLAEPGNYNQLAEMTKLAFAERDRLSQNGIADARERWKWEPRIKQYANIYKRLHTFYNVQTRPKVTVIVTAYHLDHYLPKCLDSVKAQSLEDFECIVVDDGLLDSTKEIVERYASEDRRFTYLRPEKNLGLPAARNFGFSRAKGLFIRHLDADDWLHEDALRTEVTGLENNNSIWIGYGPMQNVDAEGTYLMDGDGNPQVWATHEFSWRKQMAHINQIPSCCMVKREVFDRSGGYRKRMHKAEDAHFWCFTTSNGFRARKITDKITMYHRVHPDSKGAKEWEQDKSDGDWTAWFSYRFGATNYSEGWNILRRVGLDIPHPETVPFSVDAAPPPNKTCWDVHDYAYPKVSVIVTVGPGYEKFLQDCLDSVKSQTYPDWECIVVNDTGVEWSPNYWDSPLGGFPWAKEVYTGDNQGVSHARNVGAQHATGELLVPLDADDFWLPWFLERMVAMWEANDGVIYPDVMFSEPGKSLEPHPYKEFECQKIVQTGLYPGSSILIPRWVHDKIVELQGGWDEEIPGMEDWDYQIATHHVGACAYHLEEPLFVYRYRPDGNREKHKQVVEDIVHFIDTKWHEYRKEGKQMACGCKGKTRKTVPTSKMSSTGAVVDSSNGDIPITEQTVDLMYVGINPKIRYKGKSTGQIYTFGSQPSRQVQRVFAADARDFIRLQYQGKPLFTIYEKEKPITQDIRAFLMG